VATASNLPGLGSGERKLEIEHSVPDTNTKGHGISFSASEPVAVDCEVAYRKRRSLRRFPGRTWPRRCTDRLKNDSLNGQT
jgi:hypothetical protein